MKRIILYGASSGIGRALAQLYAAQGDMIAVAARRIENLQQLQQEYPLNILPFKVDVSIGNSPSNPNSPSVGFREMVETLGGADLVIYCSGTGKQNASLDMEIEYRTIDVNVTGFTTIQRQLLNTAAVPDTMYSLQQSHPLLQPEGLG